jgi:outer membrane lipoprotein SlyB
MRKLSAITLILVPLICSAPLTLAQKKGESARITVGVVTSAQRVELDSNAGKGALLGGALGWALARNQSSGRQAAAALGGAAVGGAGTSAAQGDRNAMRYTVQSGEGSAVQVVTDQTEVRIGDCVVVEETKHGANIRRTSPTMCQPSSDKVMDEVADEMQEEADECNQAKERLLAAKTAEEVEVAKQVMHILCNN